MRWAAVGPKVVETGSGEKEELIPIPSHERHRLDGAGYGEVISEHFFNLELSIDGLLVVPEAVPPLPVGRPWLGNGWIPVPVVVYPGPAWAGN
jgi:hypothetical protein